MARPRSTANLKPRTVRLPEDLHALDITGIVHELAKHVHLAAEAERLDREGERSAAESIRENLRTKLGRAMLAYLESAVTGAESPRKNPVVTYDPEILNPNRRTT